MRSRSIATVVVGIAGVALLAGCSTSSDTAGAGTTSASASATGPAGKITVFAAASLQQTFTELGKDYEQANPGTSVTFSFAGSSDLVTQIQNGAPADVFASADEPNMQKLTTADLIAGSAPAFATNVLQIAVAPGNPKGIDDFADLDASGLQVVTCAAPVPCGAATQKVESATGITLHPVSEEQSVTDVLGKVESGQADAGLVYVTDVQGAGDKVQGVDFDAADKAVNTYPIGVVKGSSNAALAKSFSAYVRSADGEKVLHAAGFGKP
ncbi:molybdate transport system substrate-binding protein [Curtobacterium sp. PhB130]|uniref:molybdate ABC transporter substrate-binding protein n=1 Tax=unclassified Curtobacterium TaxID=257496 RepID=UPI000F4D05F6|nr:MULTISPECIES: molybdate ABC transporter substrate-binding protein [unclassified Curtobacterium]ROP61058.1 molybdate transport system substrate-binding protein [Curtobacterium sp. ZW137]ROS75830.1 molybdate transport system substrate-binding protein [Curtobacterium sp. PhB130]TCK64435.1 molybdate transport system substrate-binding protein [Curtobacterium sp. PhB136]